MAEGVETVATLVAKLVADTTDFVRSMRKAGDEVDRQQKRFSMSGQQMAGIGKKMTLGVTLPILGAGAAAVKMSMNFETAFSRILGLTNTSASEIEMLKKGVLDLAGKTARAPNELAEALFFISSAGLTGQAALDALEASARAAAAGLGDTKSVADAVTNAINAYGQENLSAAQATDILVQAVNEGKAEAADMAPQFGRLLPLARELGVEFDETAGALAYLTQTSGDASQSATAVAGIMQKLIKPTQQGKEELEKYGLSADSIRQVVEEQGLLEALFLLKEKFGDNSESMGKFFEDAQGLVGVLALTAGSGDKVRGVMERMANAGGALDKAFDEAAQTAQHKLNQALSDLQATGIELGGTLAPMVADLAGVMGDLLSVVAKMPAPVQGLAVGFLAVLATIGPALWIMGKFQMTVERLTAVSPRAGAALGTMGKHIGRVVIGTLGAITAFEILSATVDRMGTKTVPEVERFVDALKGLSDDKIGGAIVETMGEDMENLGRNIERVADKGLWDSMGDGARRVSRFFDPFGNKADDFKASTDAIHRMDDALAQMVKSGDAEAAAAAFRQILAAAEEQGVGADIVKKAFDTYQTAIKDTDLAISGMTEEEAALKAEMDRLLDPTAQVTEEVNGLEQALSAAEEATKDLRTEFDYLFGASMDLAGAKIAVEEGTQTLIDSLKDEDSTLQDVVGNALNLIGNYQDLREAAVGMGTKVDDANAAFAMNIGAMFDAARQAGATRDELDRMLEALGLTAGEREIILNMPEGEAIKALMDEILRMLDEAERTRNIPITATTSFQQGTRGVHAHGTITTGPEFALIGEAGPEAVVPLGTSAQNARDRARIMQQAGIAMMASGGIAGGVIRQTHADYAQQSALAAAPYASFQNTATSMVQSGSNGNAVQEELMEMAKLYQEVQREAGKAAAEQLAQSGLVGDAYRDAAQEIIRQADATKQYWNEVADTAYATGQTTAREYTKILRQRQKETAKYSAEWLALENQIKSVAEDNLAQIRARVDNVVSAIGALNQRAQSALDLNKARTEFSESAKKQEDVIAYKAALLGRIQAQRDYEQALRELTAGGVDQFIAAARRAGLTAGEIDLLLKGIPGRAHGGDVQGGHPYWVGERGRRELFMPDSPGTIISDQELASLASGASGSGGSTLIIERLEMNYPPGTDGRQGVRDLKRYARNHGSVPTS